MKIFKLLIAHLLIVCSLSGATLWTVIVADTLDDQIGEALEVDVMAMSRHVRKAAKYAKLDLRLFVFSGDKANFEALADILRIEPQPDDTILFYWTGHGFRTLSKDKENNPWPNLHLGVEEAGIDHREITEMLASKGARLLISISDCCNNYISERWAPNTLSLLPKVWMSQTMEENVAAQFGHLYRESRGIIVATGAEKGEFSFCNEQLGGFFTYFLLENIRKETQGQAPTSWDSIFFKTSKDVSGYSLTQHPHYEISID
ncbi:MAG: caspase family protein [Chlamydiia bacterium]|nr:caspase family protein [Chlamydiia bacterium]